jgi:uncharacterized protein YndB with AHSA1/START domain
MMTIVGPLSHHLERSITIKATRETVFHFFTDPGRWASWWGHGSTIDARPGGAVLIRYPDGTEAVGEVVEILPPELIVFTYGYAAGTPIPPGGSRVTVRLAREGPETRLRLAHDFDDLTVRDEHVQGWRYQLSLFGNLVADEVHSSATESVDTWFALWSEPDAGVREQTLLRIATPDVRFRDRFSLVDGIPDLTAHIGAAQRFMPGVRLRRERDVRHCQGTVRADWVALGADGREGAGGTNVFVFTAGSRIESVTGFWNRHPQR